MKNILNEIGFSVKASRARKGLGSSLRSLAMTGTMILLFAGMGAVKAQIVKPTTWSFTSKKVKQGLYELHLTATVKDGWATYSQWTPEGGPEPTVISFDKNPNLLLGGKAKEVGTMKKKHEEVFGVDVHYYSTKVDFVQLVKVKKEKGNKVISGKVKYMTCDKEQCINLEEEFKVELKNEILN